MLTASENVEFELLCDREGVSTEERRNIVEEVFGTTVAQRYSDGRCVVVEFGGHRRPGTGCRATEAP